MPSRRVLACLVAGAVVLGGAVTAGPAAADPLVDAQQRADALRASVTDLQQRTDTAVEDYDGAQEDLAAAVSARVDAERALERARAAAAKTQDVRAARVRSLYEIGGPAALYGTVLHAQSPTDALRGVHVAQQLLGLDERSVRAGEAVDAQLARSTAAADAAASAQVEQGRRVSALVAQVKDLLASQSALLAGADADVVQIAQQQQQEAERQAEQAFEDSLDAARSTSAGLVLGPEVAPSKRAAVVLAAAKAEVGQPYVWGAVGPDSFDCSGLTRWAYAAAGVALPRTSREQWAVGPHVALADLQPGDLLFWANDVDDPSTIHHVAIYAGGGLMVAAPHTGDVVKVQPVYASGYIGATRVP